MLNEIGYKNVIDSIVRDLSHGSVLVSGLGMDGTLPILNSIQGRMGSRKTEIINFEQIISNSSSAFEVIKIFIIQLEKIFSYKDLNIADTASQPISNNITTIDEAYIVFEELIKRAKKEELLFLLINNFACVFLHKDYLSLIDFFGKVCQYPETVCFLFAVDSSLLIKDYFNSFQENYSATIRTIEMDVQINPIDAETIIEHYLGTDLGDEASFIVDLTGRVPVLLTLFCEEVFRTQVRVTEETAFETMVLTDEALELKDQFRKKWEALSATQKEELIHDAASNVVKKSGDLLFSSWWKSLSISEQLIILIMKLENEKLDTFNSHMVEQSLINMTNSNLNLPINMILENLRARGFLQYSGAGYEITSELHKNWLNLLFPKNRLQTEIGLRILHFAKNPTEFDRLILNKHIDLVPRDTTSSASHRPSVIKNPVILHFSDIHFGRSNAFEDIPLEKYKGMVSTLLRDIERKFKEEEIPYPNIIIVSGDVADWGMPKEYQKAEEFLDLLIEGINRINSAGQLSRNEVVIVPGNHDINWSISKGIIDESIEKNENGLYAYRLAPFKDFYHNFYKGGRSYAFDPENAFQIFDYTDHFGLLIVGFDSLFEEDHRPSNHYGYISLDAITNAEKAIEDLIAQKKIDPENIKCKVAVWHHDVRFYGGTPDNLRNAGEVLKEITYKGYSIVFTGHIHRLEQTRIVSNTSIGGESPEIIGVGSLSVRTDQRPGTPNHGYYPLSYNLVEINLNYSPAVIRIHTRQGRSNQDVVEWEPYASWGPPHHRYYETVLPKRQKFEKRG